MGHPKAKPGSALLLSGPGIVIPAQLTYPGSDNAACAQPIQPALRVLPHDTPRSTDVRTVGSLPDNSVQTTYRCVSQHVTM